MDTVVAASRSAEKSEGLRRLSEQFGRRLLILDIDVTSQASVRVIGPAQLHKSASRVHVQALSHAIVFLTGVALLRHFHVDCDMMYITSNQEFSPCCACTVMYIVSLSGSVVVQMVAMYIPCHIHHVNVGLLQW
jgi:hypothetical protein